MKGALTHSAVGGGPVVLGGRAVRRAHLVGVGGAGMAPLALLLAARGVAVTGEDDALAPEVRGWLEGAGVALGPSGEVPADTELLVHSSAVAGTHPARQEAGGRGVPQMRRGEALADLLRGRRVVAVVGAHGKTTTTAMLVTALRRAQFPAGWALGGLFAGEDCPPAAWGTNDWFVAEVDESDGTIARFAPDITVATNLDWDHPDYYRTSGEFEAAFAALFARTRTAVLLNPECPLSARLARGGWSGPAAVHTFGPGAEFDGRAAGSIDGRQRLELGGAFPVGAVPVRAEGEFNARNATAALAAAALLGVAPTPQLLADFPGVQRRQSVLLDGPVQVLEDYAHHPTEIAALVAGLRRRPHRRLVVAFQPHRFSRTARFKTEFARALAAADAVHLLDVYPAGEAPVGGGTTADIYAELVKAGGAVPVRYLPGDRAGFLAALRDDTQHGDLVVFVGAGDVDRAAREFVREGMGAVQLDARWRELKAALAGRLAPETRLVENEPLAPKTTLRVGGPARYYAEPADLGDLAAILREAARQELPVLPLGRGSNLIVPDDGARALVVRLAGPAWSHFTPQADGAVRVGAGLRLKELCGMAAAAGLRGFEFLEGIPGTVGGALRMNAGAMGGWMFDVVEEVRALAFDGTERRWRREELHASYRHCRELEGALAIEAVLQPAGPGETAAIRATMRELAERRHEMQPREPSAGCLFKNPPGDSAGRLIDAAGLKGERVGDAEVSPVHANFIVNHGGATAADVLALVRRVRAAVRARHGVELEPEVLLFGRDWREVL
jgi:UDP-N-acetylmuramate--alanine ligase